MGLFLEFLNIDIDTTKYKIQVNKLSLSEVRTLNIRKIIADGQGSQYENALVGAFFEYFVSILIFRNSNYFYLPSDKGKLSRLHSY